MDVKECQNLGQIQNSIPNNCHPLQQKNSEMFEGRGGVINKHTETKIRHKFVKKVLLTLLIQLAVTAAAVSVFVFFEAVKQYVKQHRWMMGVAFALSAMLLLVMGCFRSLMRRYPVNIIGLSVLTASQSLTLGCVAAVVKKSLVLEAVAITALIVLALMLFSLQKKFDFTKAGPYLLVIGLNVLVVGLLVVIFRYKWYTYLYWWLVLLAISIYLVVDMQKLLGGRKYEFREDEYVSACLGIYLDIVMIFVCLIEIMTKAESEK